MKEVLILDAEIQGCWGVGVGDWSFHDESSQPKS